MVQIDRDPDAEVESWYGSWGGEDLPQQGKDYLKTNPWLKFYNQQRGYCRVTLTPDLLTNDYRVMPYVSLPDAPITTRATARVQHGSPEEPQRDH